MPCPRCHQRGILVYYHRPADYPNRVLDCRHCNYHPTASEAESLLYDARYRWGVENPFR